MTSKVRPRNDDDADSDLATDDASARAASSSDTDYPDSKHDRPVSKRQKLDKQRVRSHPQWTGSFWKNAKLWYSDGDIILLCDGMGFRVRRQTLESHSAVLRDKFSAMSTNSGERYEGCDLARLPDNSAEIYHLLKSLRNKKSVFCASLSRVGPCLDTALFIHRYIRENSAVDAQLISRVRQVAIPREYGF